MVRIKAWLISFLLICSVFLASPVLADRIAKKSPDYPSVVEALNQFLEFQANPKQSEYSTVEIAEKINNLKLQKYVLETSEDWGICQNKTDKTLAVYGHDPKKPLQNTLFYLAKGQETDDNWDCEGIYIPNDVQVNSLNLIAAEPSALRIIDGTTLTATTNPTTGELVVNVPSGLLNVIPFGDINWSIPDLSQADIDAQIPNAPTD